MGRKRLGGPYSVDVSGNSGRIFFLLEMQLTGLGFYSSEPYRTSLATLQVTNQCRAHSSE
jgi:hypothetical protein